MTGWLPSSSRDKSLLLWGLTTLEFAYETPILLENLVYYCCWAMSSIIWAMFWDLVYWVKKVPPLGFAFSDSYSCYLRALAWSKRCFLLLMGSDTAVDNCRGLRDCTVFILAGTCFKGALPRSKAGVRSTSFGIIPLFSREYMPSAMSPSEIGAGSAKGSFRWCYGNTRLA